MSNPLHLNLCKDNESYPLRQGKRRETTLQEVKFDLKNDLVKLFYCFKSAVDMYNSKYAGVPPNELVRNYVSINFNQCLVSSAFKNFRNKCFFGKYKRFYFNIEGYTILFKKLNSKGRPMNVRTGNVNSINDQLTLDLFGDSNTNNPILFFGYKVDKLGNFVEPQIIYIDEGVIKFCISENDIINLKFQEIQNDINFDNNDVKLKTGKEFKKVN